MTEHTTVRDIQESLKNLQQKFLDDFAELADQLSTELRRQVAEACKPLSDTLTTLGKR